MRSLNLRPVAINGRAVCDCDLSTPMARSLPSELVHLVATNGHEFGEEFANQIANQPRGTERYQAIQGRIVEAKLANQGHTISYWTGPT